MKIKQVFFFLLIYSSVFGQNFQPLTFQVTHSGKILEFPFTGGMNAPQISGVDLNHDGITDLFIFDRIGGVPMAFILDDQVNGKYRFDQGLLKYFPQTKNWTLMQDFNRDNIPDLFTYSAASGIDGISVYRGKWISDTLHFDMLKFSGGPSPLIIPFTQANGLKTNLYVTSIDIPAIEDVDNDGDLDILSFDSGGGFINYYKNNSKENGFKSDSLQFTLDDQCWGKVFEGLSSKIALSSDPGKCSLGLLDGKITNRHVGSTLLSIDLNNNGIKDLLVGDVSYGKITALYNTGNLTKAWITSQDTAYPGYNISVEYPDFPAGYKADLFADGIDELIFSPNSTGITEDVNVFQVFKPTSSGFTQMQKSNEAFFTNEMIDVGSGSFPAFIDIDNDGDEDLIIGSFSYFTNVIDRNPRLYLYKNTGNQNNPQFELADSDYLGFSKFAASNWGFAPYFGDLDGDGDKDLLIGSEDGTLYYVENTGGVGQVPVFGTIVTNYKGIDAGQSSVPFIYDVNGDGLSDLLIGERNGNINFLPNIGSKFNPDFSSNIDASPNINFFGQVDTREPGFASGYSSPIMLKLNGKLALITGSLNGSLLMYTNIENNFTGKFTLVTKSLGNTRDGERIRPVLNTLVPSDNFQIAIGNMRGGLSIYQTFLPVLNNSTKQLNFDELKVFPNPAKSVLQFFTKNNDFYEANVSVFDISGKFVLSSNIVLPMGELNIEGLSPGLYFIKFNDGYQFQTLKFTKL